jgi:hypothetical protein
MALPIIAAALVGGLIQAAGSMVGRAMIAIGVGFVTYTGISVLLDSLKANVITYLSSGPVELLAIMSALKVDSAMNIIFSAIAARLVLKGLTSGTLKRMVLR